MDTKERRVVEGKEHGDAVLDRVLRQREKHRGRSIFVRVGVVVAGGAVSLVATPLSLPAPELEFDWAARLYVRVEKLARRVLGGLKRLFKSRRNIAVAVAMAVAVRMLVL